MGHVNPTATVNFCNLSAGTPRLSAQFRQRGIVKDHQAQPRKNPRARNTHQSLNSMVVPMRKIPNMIIIAGTLTISHPIKTALQTPKTGVEEAASSENDRLNFISRTLAHPSCSDPIAANPLRNSSPLISLNVLASFGSKVMFTETFDPVSKSSSAAPSWRTEHIAET